ncbi:hypothetical protein [Streptomyces deserti]
MTSVCARRTWLPAWFSSSMVAGAIMVVVVLEIFDESHYLVDETGAV